MVIQSYNNIKNELNPVYIMIFTALLTGINNTMQTIFSIVTLVIMLYAIKKDNKSIYIMFPILLFFYSQLVIGTLSVFRLYSIILLFEIIKSGSYKCSIPRVFVFMLIAIYISITYMFTSIKEGLFLIVDIFSVMTIAMTISTDKIIFKKFAKVFIVTAMASGIYGYVYGNKIIASYDYKAGEYANYSNRYIGTFNDPNYAGLFFNIALCYILFSEGIQKYRRIISIIIIESIIILTLSMTAISVNIMILIVYIFNKGSIILKGAISIFLISIIIIMVNYKYVTIFEEIKIIDDLFTRANIVVNDFMAGNIEEATSSRSSIFNESLKKFSEQSLHNQLIGGNMFGKDDSQQVLNGKIISRDTHNLYLNLLLCTGLFGTVIIMSIFFIRSINKVIIYKKYKKDTDFMLLLTSIVFTIYSFTLSMFPEWRFVFMLFL